MTSGRAAPSTLAAGVALSLASIVVVHRLTGPDRFEDLGGTLRVVLYVHYPGLVLAGLGVVAGIAAFLQYRSMNAGRWIGPTPSAGLAALASLGIFAGHLLENADGPLTWASLSLVVLSVAVILGMSRRPPR